MSSNRRERLDDIHSDARARSSGHLGGTIAFLAFAASSTPFALGNLNLRGTLRMVSTPSQCPPGAPTDANECRAHQRGSVSGLGSVSETYTWSYRIGAPRCPSTLGTPLATTGRLVVAGKGRDSVRARAGARCIDLEPLRNEAQAFTITGGTGTYEGASGAAVSSGTLVGALGRRRGLGRSSSPASSST